MQRIVLAGPVRVLPDPRLDLPLRQAKGFSDLPGQHPIDLHVVAEPLRLMQHPLLIVNTDAGESTDSVVNIGGCCYSTEHFKQSILFDITAHVN